MAAVTTALERLRKASVVSLIGLGLLALVGLWLIVNFFKDPAEFINIGLIGLTNGTIYGLVALGYTLIYGILQLINFAHGDVFALSGLVAWSLIVNVLGLDRDTSVIGVIGGMLLTLVVIMVLFSIANATEIVRFTLIPIIAEASVSCATARIAFPCFVELTNQLSRIRTGIVIRSAESLFHEYVTSPIPIASVRGMNDGTEWKLTP